MRVRGSLGCFAWAVVVLVVVLPGARSLAAQERGVSFDLMDVPVDEALLALIDQTRINLVYEPSVAAGKRTRCRIRDARPEDALRCILDGTGLHMSMLPSGVYVVVNAGDSTPGGRRRTVSGFVSDAETGETLVGVNVYAVSFGAGTVTNRYGWYSITLPEADSTTMAFTYVGFEPQVKKVFLVRDIRLDVRLSPGTSMLEEVTVTADATAAGDPSSTVMGVIDVPIRFVERLPAILGEQDVLKVIQLLPGVQAGEEGTTGFQVRGGAADQNLVELDEAIVYNPNHLFGLFSTFNPRALSTVQLVKGGFPAQYGGRLSSVLRIGMREGNRRRFEGQAGIGLTSSNLTLEGPVLSDRMSFIVSARRSYLDLLVRPFQKDRIYWFYDANAKTNVRAGPDDHVFVSGFVGRDNAEYRDASGLGYGIRFGNSTATVRWNHLFGNRLFANLSLIENRYFIRVNTIQGSYYSQNYSGIRDVTAKLTLEYHPTPRHGVQMGGTATSHRFRSTGTGGQLPPGQIVEGVDPGRIPERRSTEAAVYVHDEWDVSDRFGVSAGIRVPYYTVQDTSFSYLEPRLIVRVGVANRTSVKASFTRMHQFVHLVPSSTASLPTDIWTPASRVAHPQRSTQYAAGVFTELGRGRFEASVEAYYKDMRKQVLFREGTQLLAYEEIDDELTFGRGWSYGAELFLRRRAGRLSGWLSYTLSWARQRFPALNRGEAFPFKYDRRHNLAVVATYRLSDRWTVSGNVVYLTGPVHTLPVGRVYASLGGELYQGLFYDYDRVNNYRLGAHHRLDVSVSYALKPRFFDEGELVLSIYNVYSRQNPYFVYLGLDDRTQEPVARQVSLLPIVPAVTYTVRF